MSERQRRLFADAGLARAGDGALLFGGVAVEQVARGAGTPAYAYNAAIIRDRYRALSEALGALPHRIHYAVKANSSLAVLGLLREAGAGCDIVSAGELQLALRAGFPPGHIVFSGVGKTPEEIRMACGAGLGQVNIESLEELEALGREARESGRTVSVGIRVNPDVTVDTHPYITTGTAAAKFGIPADRVLHAAARIREFPNLVLTGVAMHVGSQLLEVAPYVKGARLLAGLVGALRDAGVTTLRSIDIGGGLGIRYRDETPLEPGALAAAVVPVVAPLGLTLHLEPGRYLVGSAGILLTTVLYRKQAGGKAFVVVDAGMTDLVRPSRYQAHHELVPARDRALPEHPVDVVGPICETGDFLALDRPLQAPEAGDVLAILCAGAYGFVMASRYNARPLPPEVLVDHGAWRVVRQRETIDDLMRGEVA